MATFIGTGVSETITPAFVSAGVTRIPAGSFPGAAADVILARGGNDVTDGGGGNDVIDGGDGNDSLRGNTGADVLIGGTGTDTATYTESAAGVNVSLTTGLGFGGSAAGDTLVEIENLNGSDFADTLTGDALANSLNGFVGNDILNGQGGNDTLNGGDGNDSLDGWTGNDTLNGDAGNDTLLGFSGNDTLNGGVGDDTLNGEADNDTLNGGDGIDTLNGGSGNDTMNGGLGNDTMNGSLGTDVMTGGGGLDRFDFNSVSESLPGVGVRDVITDFVGDLFFGGFIIPGDTIDVSGIDANVNLALDQAFTFIGGAAFTPITIFTPLGATGQLRYAGGVLQGSTDADALPEFEVQLTGAPALSATDLVL